MSSFDTPCVMAPVLNWRTVMDGLVGAYADNTLRGYRADIAKLKSWRLSRGEPLLPASPDTVAAFIADDARVSSSATLRRRLASIRSCIGCSGCPIRWMMRWSRSPCAPNVGVPNRRSA